MVNVGKGGAVGGVTGGEGGGRDWRQRGTLRRERAKRGRGWREAPVEILDLRVKIDVSDRSEWI